MEAYPNAPAAKPRSTRIGSECTVTKTMRASGSRRRIRAAASIPSRPGIEMSVTITSGVSRAAALTRA
jgi:hypothetical protein